MPPASSVRVVLACLPAAFFSLHAKGVLLENEGLRIAARHLGLASEAELGVLDVIGFYRLDLAAGSALLPAMLLLLTRPLPARLRPAFAAFAAGAVLLIQYAQMRAYLAVGRFLTPDLVWQALQRAGESPEDLLAYDSPGSLAKLATLLALTALPALPASALAILRSAARSTAPSPAPSPAPGRSRRAVPIAFAAAFLGPGVLSLAWLPEVRGTYYHRSMMAEAVRHLAAVDASQDREFAGRAHDELMAEYRSLARSPGPVRDGPRWGQAKGFHVLVFLMESIPSACMPLDGPLEDMPVVDSLRRGSVVALAHHSTYPYTNRAVYSLFTARYPSTRTHGFLPVPEGARLPGLARSLAAEGYRTAAYFPIRQTFASDELMFAALGVESQRYPTGAAAASAEQESGWRKLLARDHAALDLLVADIAAWGGGPPRLAVFLPQVGHGPWPDVRGGGETEVLRRGRAMAALHDPMLGRALEALRRSGQADRTVVLLTSDHGLRTRMEYADLPGGRADSISFHVPLLLSVPGAPDPARRIPWITSHIDVAPALLDLLGVEAGRGTEQGVALWDARLADRVTFFLGRHYSGADAYHERGAYFMWSHPSASGFGATPVLHFPAGSARPAYGTGAEAIRSRIARMASLQDALLAAETEEPGRAGPGGRSSAGAPLTRRDRP